MAEKEARIHKELSKSFKKAKRISVDIDSVRWVIFSDHHRGSGDGADDFKVCEQNYLDALAHYQENDFTLCLLGDVEEFWENTPLIVMAQYLNVLEAEKAYYDQGRLLRIWGNHDDDWRIAGQISKYMGRIFPKIMVHEAIVLELTKGPLCREILLIHGHQGTLDSDRWAWASRLFVRFIWRNIQRLFKVSLSTPSNNTRLKSEHDKAMYQWADRHDKVLISGHTHHPVFMSYTHADQLKEEIIHLEEQQEAQPTEIIEEEIQIKKQRLYQLQLEGGESLDVHNPKPFYFNSGCCSYADGDITGLELSDGQIRLIKWQAKDGKRKILGSTRLQFLLDYC